MSIRRKVANWIAGGSSIYVPREPTTKMLNAASKALSPSCRPTQEWVSVKKKHRIRYKAMIESTLGGDSVTAKPKVPCPQCGERVKKVGLSDHIRDKHVAAKTLSSTESEAS